MWVCPECGESSQGPGPCVRDRVALVDGSAEPLLGQFVGSYRIACRIGAGGMGQVFRAVQPAIGSRVAIKVLDGRWAEQVSQVERFFLEARAVNLIRHEHIVNVLDLAWLPDRRPYIIMEYLEGSPLSALIRQRGPLPLGSLAQLVYQVASALEAAHQKGVVHRDLKPDNIFVTRGGNAKVLDFGIAKLEGEQGSPIHAATATGAILGTPYYLSPEQARGHRVDFRADLYSLGVVLFECCTGRVPFAGSSLFELLKQHIEAAPPAPEQLRPSLPPEFSRLILRLLHKDPAQRPASAHQLGLELREIFRVIPEPEFAALSTDRSSELLRIPSLPSPTTPVAPVDAGGPGWVGRNPGTTSIPATLPSATRMPLWPLWVVLGLGVVGLGALGLCVLVLGAFSMGGGLPFAGFSSPFGGSTTGRSHHSAVSGPGVPGRGSGVGDDTRPSRPQPGRPDSWSSEHLRLLSVGRTVPVVVGEANFPQGEQALTALDGNTGLAIWRQPLASGGNSVFTDEASVILLVTSENYLSRHDVSTGAAAWKIRLGEGVADIAFGANCASILLMGRPDPISIDTRSGAVAACVPSRHLQTWLESLEVHNPKFRHGDVEVEGSVLLDTQPINPRRPRVVVRGVRGNQEVFSSSALPLEPLEGIHGVRVLLTDTVSGAFAYGCDEQRHPVWGLIEVPSGRFAYARQDTTVLGSTLISLDVASAGKWVFVSVDDRLEGFDSTTGVRLWTFGTAD